MGALLVSVLSGFGTYLVGSLVARVASLVAFSAIGSVLISTLLNQAVAKIGGAGEVLWFVQLMGIGTGLSSIGAALILRATMKAWSLKPGSAITGG